MIYEFQFAVFKKIRFAVLVAEENVIQIMLTKSDFKIALSCPKKLIYKKRGYGTKNDEDGYITMLAEGGHIVGKLAQLYYPDGLEIVATTLEDAIEETRMAVADNVKVTLFEATFSSGDKIVRVDILEKNDNVLNIIEVKSKSFDSNDRLKSIRDLRDSIDDVAFQAMILHDAYPGFEVNSYLLLPEKSRRTSIEGLPGWFTVNEGVMELFENDELPAQASVQYKKHQIVFNYDDDPNRQKYITQLIEDRLLTLVDVKRQVMEVDEAARIRAEQFLRILNDGISETDYSINKNCVHCEFNLGQETLGNGYRECWGELANIDPHIFDLYYGGGIRTRGNYYLDELISERKVSFSDLDVERFRNQKGDLGPRGFRQQLQVEKTLANEEWINNELQTELNNLEYPLHFIDFETYGGAIPFFKRMRPFEKVAFQWSCHTVESPDSAPTHSEWLNCDYNFPNFLFAQSLMDKIGDTGTPLMWSSYENTTLRDILAQIDIHGYENSELKTWLTEITKDEERDGRFVDLNELTLRHYFHPMMKGKTSIKKVLPAVLCDSVFVSSIPWVEEFVLNNSEGAINPYDNLSSVIEDMETEELVEDGTDAMKAYYEIMYGSLSEDQTKKDAVKRNLLKYCRLDSMAMVIIWKYWMYKLRG